MTTTNAMTIEDLLEDAALDAFGLLDEYETALYTRSFHNAPAAIQDQIIELQARLVSDETLMPSATPDPTLRQRVLNAVSVAIEHDTAHLKPLAVIGRPRAAAIAAVPFRLSAYGQFWRAAAFALFASLIVVLYFMIQLSATHYEVATHARYNNTEAQMEELIGPTFKTIFFADSKMIGFKVAKAPIADPPLPEPKAKLIYAEGEQIAMLVIQNLPQTVEPYMLRMIDAQGAEIIVETFQSTGKLGGVHVAIGRIASHIPNATWEITGGGIVLTSI